MILNQSTIADSPKATRTIYRSAREPVLNGGGWQFIPSCKDRKEMEFVASEGVYANKGGRLEGPAIRCAIDPFAFYRLRFLSRFEEAGYYAVMFQDAAGQDQVDDIYGGVDPSPQWIQQEFCFRGRELAQTFRLKFISHGAVAIKEVTVEQVDHASVCQWADQLYGLLPPLEYLPPANRCKLMPCSINRLRAGGALRVVMLGDSIVNDTNNSNWDALVMRRYRGCRIHVVTSVRGSTGCWHYRQEAQLKSYVLDRHPELLMIGGISHRQDIEAIRAVIDQVRAASPCEILLMSGPMGEDWRPPAPTVSLPRAAYEGDDFNARLACLAEQQGVAFLDLNTLWHQYLGASGKPWGWFHRDRVHANDRGKQILARFLDRYLAQDTEWTTNRVKEI